MGEPETHNPCGIAHDDGIGINLAAHYGVASDYGPVTDSRIVQEDYVVADAHIVLDGNGIVVVHRGTLSIQAHKPALKRIRANPVVSVVLKYDGLHTIAYGTVVAHANRAPVGEYPARCVSPVGYVCGVERTHGYICKLMVRNICPSPPIATLGNVPEVGSNVPQLTAKCARDLKYAADTPAR